jgi:hypothetical protein
MNITDASVTSFQKIKQEAIPTNAKQVNLRSCCKRQQVYQVAIKVLLIIGAVLLAGVIAAAACTLALSVTFLPPIILGVACVAAGIASLILYQKKKAEAHVHINIPDPLKSASPKEWLQCIRGQNIDQIEKDLLKYELPLLEDAARQLDPAKKDSKSMLPIIAFAQQMKRVALIRDLQKIAHEFEKQNRPDLVENVLSDWKYFGQSIQANTVLRENRKKKLLNLPHADKALEELRQGKVNALDANEDLIDLQYPALKEALKDDKDLQPLLELRQKQYRGIVNRAWIALTLKIPGKFAGKAIEGAVIHELGYDKLLYLDRFGVHQKMNIVLNEMLKQDLLESATLRELKTKLFEQAYDERLKLAKVKQEDIPFVKEAIASSKSLKSQISQEANKCNFTHQLLSEIELDKYKYLASRIENLENHYKNSFGIAQVKIFIQNVKKKMNSISVEQGLFIERLKKSLPEELQIKVKEPLSKDKEIIWFNKYKKYFVFDFDQGFKPQEVFDEGVCCALVHRIVQNVIKNPHCNDEELEGDRILPIDRYRQSYYGLGYKFGDRQAIVHPDPTKKTLSRDLLFYTKYENGIERIRKIISEADVQKMHGVLVLSIVLRSEDGHALMLQIDKTRDIYRIYDPNFGMLRLRPAQFVPGHDMVEETIKVLFDTLSSYYDINMIAAWLPKQEPKRPSMTPIQS